MRLGGSDDDARVCGWGRRPAPAEDLPKATAVSAGGGHTCALLSNATVKCWGSNSDGQLGDGTHTRRLTAVAVHGLAGVKSVSAGLASCARSRTARPGAGGTITRPARGRDDDQPLDAGRRPGPHRRRRRQRRRDQRVRLAGRPYRGLLGRQRQRRARQWNAGEQSDAGRRARAERHHRGQRWRSARVCAACERDGELLGLEQPARSHRGPGDQLTPTLVPNLTDAVSVGADPFHSCALTARGVAECWDRFSPPTVVHGFANVKAFSFSHDGQQTEHTCAVIAGGTVKCQSPLPVHGTDRNRPDGEQAGGHGARPARHGDQHQQLLHVRRGERRRCQMLGCQ